MQRTTNYSRLTGSIIDGASGSKEEDTGDEILTDAYIEKQIHLRAQARARQDIRSALAIEGALLAQGVMLQDLASSEEAGAPHDACPSEPWHRTAFRRISLDGSSLDGTDDLYPDVVPRLPLPPPLALERSEQRHGAGLVSPGALPTKVGDMQDKLANSYQRLVQHCEREDILMDCVVLETGLPSSPTFTAQIMVEGKKMTRADGRTKKEAVRLAAHETLSQLLNLSSEEWGVSECGAPQQDENASLSWGKNDECRQDAVTRGCALQLLEDEPVGCGTLKDERVGWSRMQLLEFYCTRNELSLSLSLTEHGPAHDKTFCCKVFIYAADAGGGQGERGDVEEDRGDARGGKEMAVATAKRKRLAMHQAAEEAMHALQIDAHFQPLSSMAEFAQEYNKVCPLLDFKGDAVLLLRHWCGRNKRVYVLPASAKPFGRAEHHIYLAEENGTESLITRMPDSKETKDLPSELLVEKEAQTILRMLRVDQLELSQHYLVNRCTREVLQDYCESHHINVSFDTQETDKFFAVSVTCDGKDMGVCVKSKCPKIAAHLAANDVLVMLQDQAERQLFLEQQLEQKKRQDQQDALLKHAKHMEKGACTSVCVCARALLCSSCVCVCVCVLHTHTHIQDVLRENTFKGLYASQLSLPLVYACSRYNLFVAL